MAAVEVDGTPIVTEPLINLETGEVSEVWWIYFNQLFERTGGSNDAVANSAPIGSTVGWPSNTIPDDWLACDGSAVSRTTFSELFEVVGITFGAGDGSTTFNVPDTRGRALIGSGQGALLTNRTIGDTGGAETIALTTAELAAHIHGVTDTGHIHGVTDTGHIHATTESPHNHSESSGNFVNDAAGTEYLNTGGDKGTTNANTASTSTGLSIDSATTGISVDSATTGISVDSTGSGTAHENMMPFLAMNCIIRAL